MSYYVVRLDSGLPFAAGETRVIETRLRRPFVGDKLVYLDPSFKADSLHVGTRTIFSHLDRTWRWPAEHVAKIGEAVSLVVTNRSEAPREFSAMLAGNAFGSSIESRPVLGASRPAAIRAPMKLQDTPTHDLLHAAWSAAKGSEGYSKTSWMAIQRLASDLSFDPSEEKYRDAMEYLYIQALVSDSARNLYERLMRERAHRTADDLVHSAHEINTSVDYTKGEQEFIRQAAKLPNFGGDPRRQPGPLAGSPTPPAPGKPVDQWFWGCRVAPTVTPMERCQGCGEPRRVPERHKGFCRKQYEPASADVRAQAKATDAAATAATLYRDEKRQNPNAPVRGLSFDQIEALARCENG